MSRQPSSARCATTELPTMPDPITTTLAALGTSLTLVLLPIVWAVVGDGRRTVATRSRDHLPEVARRVLYVGGDRGRIRVAGEAVARAVAVNRGDGGAVCVDDRCGDR